MMRKLLIVLLAGAICLTGTSSLLAKEVVNIYTTPEAYQKVTGKKISKFSEAPMLTEKVATGELPPLEERLPEEPLVLEPAEEIGQYGGTLRGVNTLSMWFIHTSIPEYPLCYSSGMYAPDVKKVIQPNIFKSWTVSDDAKTWTFHIRKGIKWSDGEPFTAADFMFWYEDVALNKDLRPTGVRMFKIGGEMGKFKKIDDYTISYSFVEPYGVLLEELASSQTTRVYLPKHFLKQFHPKYTPKDELDKTVKEAGFDSWVSLFEFKKDWWNDVETPTICAWKPINKASEPVYQFVRNPFYWKIDTEGNQLPYLDRIEHTLSPDVENCLMRVLAGEVDEVHGNQIGGSRNLPLLKEYEKKADYRIIFGKGGTPAWGTVLFNLSHEDPVLREIFRDKRFRIALSVAMNREEINELVYAGRFIPTQARPPVGAPYHGELPQFNVYSQYDPQLANQLLDGMGLKWDKGHEVRLRPDGKPLELVATVAAAFPDVIKTAEMYKRYWKKIGVEITIKPSAQFGTIMKANKHDLGIWAINLMGGRRPFFAATWRWALGLYSNPAWGLWCTSRGEKGDEPPKEVKRLYELSQKFVAESSEEKRIAIEKEALLIACDNLWTISAVYDPGESTVFWVISNRLRNMPSPRAYLKKDDQPSTWFIKK